MSSATAARERIASVEELTVSHGRGRARIDALGAVSLGIDPGESLALWGRSGSGKTTLLHALGGLIEPTPARSGVRGKPLSSLDAAGARGGQPTGSPTSSRAPTASPLHRLRERCLCGCRGEGGSARRRHGATQELLELVGLAAKLDNLPSELSGGESQRVAIARALAQRPDLLLCDEPTGHLDSDTGARVLDLIDALREEYGFALVVATHDANVAARYSRTIELADGRIVAGGGRTMSATARLVFAGLVRSPGRTLIRIVVLSAATALLGAMLLFIGNSLQTMAASAVRSVPLDWQGPVLSGAQAQRVAAGVARQPGIAQASATATAPLTSAASSGPAGTTRSGSGSVLAVPPNYLSHIKTFRLLQGALRPGQVVLDQQMAATLQARIGGTVRLRPARAPGLFPTRSAELRS